MLSKLKVVGNRLVDEYGRERMLRGANLMDWEWKYSWRQSPTFELASIPVLCGPPPDGWGANVVHMAVHSGPVNRGEAKYLNGLDSIVWACEDAGAYCLLCYRSPEPNAALPVGIDDNAASTMGKLADRYKYRNTVLYGAGVEPHDITWATLRPQLERVIDAIRVQVPDSVVFCPGTQWSRYVHWALTDPVQRNNVVYRVDYYDPFSKTDTSYRLKEVAARYPVFLGEFGAGDGTGASTTLDDVKLLLDYCELNGIGWCAWNFNDEGQPHLLTSKTTFAPSTFGTEVKARLQSNYVDSHPPAPEPPPPPDPTPVTKKYLITLGSESIVLTVQGLTITEVT